MTDEKQEAELNRLAEEDAYADARTGAQGPHTERIEEFVKTFVIGVAVLGGIVLLAAIIFGRV